MRHVPTPVVIREVGLRDGLQSISTVIPTERKCAWIRDAVAAGQRHIEVASFVPPRSFRQMADANEVLAYAKGFPELVVSVLVPNVIGVERALAGNPDSMLFPLSASHAHSLANLRKTPDEALAEFARIRAARDASGRKTLLEGGVGTAFGCTLQGRVEPDEVLRLVQALLDAGADRVSLADSVGYADPLAVSRLFERARRIAGDRLWLAHFHDTRGLALANVLAALDIGITAFDASLAGIGGCPATPGATGNVATEDLVHMAESMGCATGIELPSLLALRTRVAGWIPQERTFGSLARAGLPKTFAAAPSSAARPAAGARTLHSDEGATLPLAGVRVVEFTHMVMGPTCGMILADLGAEVIKVEPPGGDKTRDLPGLGIGFFRTCNRNKKSVVLDLQTPRGREQAAALAATADVVLDNFRPGLMASLGLDHATLGQRNPRLIYASHKGFLPGPYEQRVALDEVVQMMGGLAYMTGPVGRPLRAGASVNDIMGGMFGAIGVLAALRERERSGRGQEIQSGLFENCAFLVATHVHHYLMTGEPPPPLTARVSPWSVYDVFDVAEGEQLFLTATNDKQFRTLCGALGCPQLADEPVYATNAGRVARRPELLARLAVHAKNWHKAELAARMEAAGLPYAPINRPDHLVTDPHLLRSGALVPMQTDDGRTTQALLLPITLGGRRLGVRMPLARVGEHDDEVLGALAHGASLA